MPDILAVLEATPQGTAGHRCKVGRWLDTLACENGHDELEAAFDARPGIGRTTPQLAAIAARLGHPISDKTIGEHRRGECRCAW